MRRTRRRVLILSLLAAGPLLLPALPISAQTTGPQGSGQGSGQGNGQYKGPGIPGKMNSTKNTERWAAAVRNANRRADQNRLNRGKGKK